MNRTRLVQVRRPAEPAAAAVRSAATAPVLGLSWLRHPVVASALLAAALQSLWAALLATNGGDMAAQYAWAQFAAAHPGSAYDLAWYGGMHPVSYSVLAPYLMAWLGVRTSAVLAGTLSAAVLARLLMRSGLARPLLPALCAAAALAGNVASGRITFAIGALFGLAAVLAVLETRGAVPVRIAAAGLLAMLATTASPVDGLFLLAVAPALFLTGHRWGGFALAAGPPLVVATTTLLFPFYGVQPYGLGAAGMVLVTALPVALLVSGVWRTVRIGAWTYLLGNLLALLIPSPIGSNVERMALLFAGAVLLAAAMSSRGRRAVALWLAFAVAFSWQSLQPVLDLRVALAAKGWTQYAQPLAAELNRLGADRGRVEVVGAASHVEASSLAPAVELARGWNRQVDTTRNPLFYRDTLTPAAYHAWLRDWAVGYVVLPMATPDFASETEGDIVADGQPWLRPVWSDPHWSVYRVTDAVPLVSAPADVLNAGEAGLTLRVPEAGTTLVRVVWSPWLDVVDGTDSGEDGGCLAPDGGWTRLTTTAAGTFRIGSGYALPRGSACRTG
jgi:hypothetical protein